MLFVSSRTGSNGLILLVGSVGNHNEPALNPLDQYEFAFPFFGICCDMLCIDTHQRNYRNTVNNAAHGVQGKSNSSGNHRTWFWLVWISGGFFLKIQYTWEGYTSLAMPAFSWKIPRITYLTPIWIIWTRSSMSMAILIVERENGYHVWNARYEFGTTTNITCYL